MSFYTTKAFMLRENNGELGVELPSDIKELLKQRGLTVVFVSGDVECDGEFVKVINDKLTQEEITKEALQLLNKETLHMVGALGLPKHEKIKLPVVNIVPRIDSMDDLLILIKMAKKKLKKLQKRQRKQDNQGVVSVDDIINAPVITERLDVSERPIVCDTMTMSEFIKFRDKMARPS